MRRVLSPLEMAGVDGLDMVSGNSLTRRCHPLLACIVEDYLEQVLTTCTYTGKCLTCTVSNEEFGKFFESGSTELRDVEAILKALDSFDTDPAGYLQTCHRTLLDQPSLLPYLSLHYA